jgi:DNA-binding transcriptional ArsR family regulator
MSKYQDTLSEHARIAILRLLEEAPKYTSNVSMIKMLLHPLGIGYTRDQVTTEVNWLKEQGLVTIEDHAGFMVVTATVRGLEVAQGIARHPGVQRPKPGS